MCGVNEAMAVLSIMNSVNDFQAGKAKAKAQKEANRITVENANISYLNDIQKIEGEKVEAAREFALEDFKNKMDLRKKQAQALNLGFGNPFKIVQDLAGAADTDYVELQNAFLSDMYKANYQYTQAYANMQKTRSQYVKPVSEPSALGLGVQIATTAGAYALSPNSIINQPKSLSQASNNALSYGSGTGGFEGFKPAGQFEIPTRTLGGK